MIAPKTQHEEIAFFKRVTPLSASSSFEAGYIVLFELYAAAVERDYAAFCRGVDRIQQTAWKRAERSEYGNTLAILDAGLRDAGADCVGMSSLGPMLFCFTQEGRLSGVAEAAEKMGCDIYRATPVNRGREIVLKNA